MFSAEVSVGQNQRSHQGPQEDGQAEPAGADLHPHGRHGALHRVVVRVGPDEMKNVSRDSNTFHISTFRLFQACRFLYI